MAAKGTTKWFSMRQEARVAKRYLGTVSPSSGGAFTDAGDVRNLAELIEAKHTGTFDRPRRSISVKLSDLEKVADEAWAEGRMPVLALSIYSPDSVLAGLDGCVDLTVRLQTDDYEVTDDGVNRG